MFETLSRFVLKSRIVSHNDHSSLITEESVCLWDLISQPSGTKPYLFTESMNILDTVFFTFHDEGLKRERLMRMCGISEYFSYLLTLLWL